MDREDIIRMAMEAGFNVEQGFLLRVTGIDEDLERFAKLVAAAERRACARWCDIVAREVDDINGLAGYCAKGIRARNGIRARSEK